MMDIYFIIALAAMLLAIMIMAHPRFLARLLSSVHRKRAARAEEAARPVYTFDMAHVQKNAVLNRAPRVVAGGDLTKGWFLRRGNRSAAFRAPSAGVAKNTPNPPAKAEDPFASTVSLPYNQRRCTRSTLAPPPHIAPFTSRIPFSSIWESAPFSHFPFPLRTRATVKTLLIVVIYVVFSIVACTYKSKVGPKAKGSGYGEDFLRTGKVAMSQVPIAIALGVRGNIVGLLVGKGYNHLRIFHKVVGRVLFVAASLHSIFYLVKWAKAGALLKRSISPIGLTGNIAFAAVCLIAVTSLPRFRASAYGVFKVSHYIGIVTLLAGMGAHVPSAVPWAIASGIIYAVSILFGLAKSRVTRAELVALSGNATTMITLPGITTGWRAGQHVRLRVPSIKGALNKMECHPFTIASAPDSGGLVLLAKVAGDWTHELYNLATKGGGSADMETGTGVWRPRTTTVIVEGPYGGLGNTLPTSFSSVVLVAGGSGITNALAFAQDLVGRSPSGVVAARTVDLIWVVRVEQTAKVILPTLNNLVAQAHEWEEQALEMRKGGADIAYPTALRIHIFVTRVPKSSPLRLLDDSPTFTNHKADKEAKLYPYSGSSSQGHGSDESSDDHDGMESLDDHTPMTGDWHSHPYGGAAVEPRPGPYPLQNAFVASYTSPPHTRNNSSMSLNRPFESPAERAKADWLQRNPSNASIARLHERTTNKKKAMSSITAYRGRPDFRSVINAVASETMARFGTAQLEATGVLVQACGPEFMVNDVRHSIHTVPPFKAKACGGIEFESEFFGI